MFAYINNGYVRYVFCNDEYMKFDDDFKSHCVECTEDVVIGMKYNSSTGEFAYESVGYIPSSEETADNGGSSISDLETAIAELAEKQELDKQEIETAIAELAESLM